MRNLLTVSSMYVKKHAPTILTCIGAVGVVTTSVLAVKATPKAVDLLEEAKTEKGEELTKTEIVAVAGPVYIPAVVAGLSTITCIFAANTLNKRQQAALTSAYALLDSMYKEYKNKVNELYGEEEEFHIREEITKDNYTNDISLDDNELLFYDYFSGRYFNSTIEKVQRAEYRINRDLTTRDYAYLNEFYEYLDIPPIEAGWKLGWSTGASLDMYWQTWIDFDHKKITLDDGLECRIITIQQEPIVDFENYF